MTDDGIDAMYRSLGLRTESLRLNRERATTPGELAILDEVEAQIRVDALRYKAAARAAEARQRQPNDAKETP